MADSSRPAPPLFADHSSPLVYSPLLGRRVRTGGWDDQQVGTYHKVRQALSDQRWRDASVLADCCVDEARVCYDLYRQWMADISQFLERRGVESGEVAAINRHLLSLLDLPDGSPFEARQCWVQFLDQVRDFHMLCGERNEAAALAKLEQIRESWRQLHDRDVDHSAGLISEVGNRLGEAAVEPMFHEIMLPLFEKRYGLYDVRKHAWEDSLQALLYITCESMRAHLSGPLRCGDLELWEEEERWVARFDPCGSGGRTMRADKEEKKPPRMEPPYNQAVTKEAHDWAWGKKGVCLYCVHCCILMEQMPIDAFGYPLRVVEPPTYPEQADVKCTWYMYKDPHRVPAEYYKRVGRSKPE